MFQNLCGGALGQSHGDAVNKFKVEGLAQTSWLLSLGRYMESGLEFISSLQSFARVAACPGVCPDD